MFVRTLCYLLLLLMFIYVCENYRYVAPEKRLEPRETKQYKRGYTNLPEVKHWGHHCNTVLVPAGKRYMLIFAFHYQNFVIIETFITYILILSFHCAACLCLATRSTLRQRPTRTSLAAYLGSISLGLSVSLVVAATWLGLGTTTATPTIRWASAGTCNGGLSGISGYVTFGFLAFEHTFG